MKRQFANSFSFLSCTGSFSNFRICYFTATSPTTSTNAAGNIISSCCHYAKAMLNV
ncbi:MAG: hypothetical protein ABI402_02615 [Ferruginibacter sp.]